jgi:hypothetical protein
MSSRRICVILSSILLVFAVVISLVRVAPAFAQGAQTTPALRRIAVTILQVKPDAVDEYMALVKNVGIPAEKKSGMAWRATYRPVFGELYTLITVRPVTNLAEYDEPSALNHALGPDAAQKFGAKFRQNVVSQRVTIQTIQPQFSIESGMTTPANLILVTEYKILPGKGPDYNNLLTSTILPALRKNGVKDYWVHTTNFGAPQHRTVVRPIANFAELDRGASAVAEVTRLNGAEAGQKLQQQFGSILDSIETSVLRLVPDLSFSQVPAKPVTAK